MQHYEPGPGWCPVFLGKVTLTLLCNNDKNILHFTLATLCHPWWAHITGHQGSLGARGWVQPPACSRRCRSLATVTSHMELTASVLLCSASTSIVLLSRPARPASAAVLQTFPGPASSGLLPCSGACTHLPARKPTVHCVHHTSLVLPTVHCPVHSTLLHHCTLQPPAHYSHIIRAWPPWTTCRHVCLFPQLIICLFSQNVLPGTLTYKPSLVKQ